jgi:tRNA A-37 threonylcarbamoyl transferase component Bud32
MKRITDVTRQDIIDIIKYGIWIPYDQPKYDEQSGRLLKGYSVSMPKFGRLEELEFLSRIYDLENMPSTDRRFSNAKGDIWQHTINNSDWEEYWYFVDDRFHLSNGCDDSYILRFICEMLHPAVRIENSEWQKYLEKFNLILEPDGYCLLPVQKISGREVYEAREIDHIEISHSNENIYAGMKAIGEGSYAKVFRFTDTFYNKDFVLKRAKSNLDEKERQRFKREFQEMLLLHSPYIVEVYSYNEEKHEYTMELMDSTLEKYINENNVNLNLQARRNIIMQLIRAYKYLHSKNIYHRDVSPKNVLLKFYDDTVIVKLSDFGLVKIVDSELTSENTDLKGSLNDPALKVEGFGNYGLIHELYAITLLFVYILTGKTNWAKINNPIVKSFMDKGTNPDKTKRFQTLDELALAVKKCMDEMQV